MSLAASSVVALLALGPPQVEGGQPGRVTYTEHIAPILNARCVTCHRPGAVGPFSLATFEDVASRAEQIATVTGSGYMPPWKPSADFGTFRNDRRLDGAEIELIRRWVRAGAPRGDLRHLPPAPVWPAGWQLGRPDLVVTMTEPYVLPAASEDVYRNFVVPIPIAEARFVSAVELQPGTVRGIHHARIMLDRTTSARRLDAGDLVPGYDSRLADQSRSPEGHFLGWAPGTVPSIEKGLAWRLEPGTDLVLKTHLVPRGTPASIQVAVGLFFTDRAAADQPVVVQLGSQTIDIPAGDSRHEVRDEYRLPVDVDVLAIYPHAHYLARTVSSFARLPDGTTRALIRIDDWDFNWQDEYRYARPVRLPAGSRVVMSYVYDNSAHNRRNPNRVPRRVRFGPRATDEMAELMVQVRPVDAGDAAILRQDVAGKVAQIVVGGAEARLAEDPASPALHEELAVRLATAGRVEQSIEHLEQAIRLDPNRATAHYNLATALVRRGEIGAAMARYRQVLALDPNHAGAHNNLGGLLQSIGRHAEAAQQYRRAVRIDPNHAGAQYNLANILLAESRFGEAEAALRQALAVRPADPDVHASLGHALVGQGRIDAGVAEYREALRLAPDRPQIYRYLGDAFRTQGRLAEAGRALAVARELEARQR